MSRPISRETIAAAILAPLVVAAAAFAWFRRDPGAGACCSSDRPVSLEAPIPTDSLLRSGRLSNALHYYVRANGSPAGRAELRLVVNAGSVLEADDQRGLAHAVEHMLFRGTQHFPGHAVDDYLQSIGMRPGSDVNASTSRDETVVQITVPTDRAGAVDTALAILADMAHLATFDTTLARQEAGVVMSEWRSRSAALARMTDDRDALLFAGSRYADRRVIGDTAVLRRFDVAAMRRFYDDWYRPDLMAVVAVGDFDDAAVEQSIKKYFGSIPAQHGGRTRPSIDVPTAASARAAVLGDPEATATGIALWHVRRPSHRQHLADYRASLIDELWRRILDERLADASEREGSPILGSSVETSTLARALEADVVRVHAADKRESTALGVLATEVARVARFGVSAADVKRRGAALLRERRNAEEWSDESSDIADSFVETFLTGDVFVNRATALELTRTLLPTIDTTDILARARAMSIDSTAVIFVTEPRRADQAASPTDLVALARAASDHVSPLVADTIASAPLVPNPPAPGRVATERIDANARAFDWRLSNGMRVILKPTRFVFDQVELRLQGDGGASLANDADYPSAYSSDAVVRSTGVGSLPGRLLDRRLDETSVSLSASVRDDEIEFYGSAAPRDLEVLFQVLHLYFTQPRPDTVAFHRYQERLATYARGRVADPDVIFEDSVAAAVSQHHPRSAKGDRFASAVDLSKALAFWNARMANASGFTLVMTGDFTLDRARTLATRYLGSLPAGAPEHARDVGIRFPHGVVRRQIVAGKGPKARTQIVLSGPFDGTNESTTGLDATSDLAELALNSTLRERLGGTYDASVHSSANLIPPATYTVTIDFEASPDRIDSLGTAALAELDRLRTDGPTELEYQKIKAARVRDLDGKIENNAYWATELSWHARMGWPLGTIVSHQLDAKRLSKAALQAACGRYLRTSEYVQVTMYPRSSPPWRRGESRPKIKPASPSAPSTIPQSPDAGLSASPRRGDPRKSRSRS